MRYCMENRPVKKNPLDREAWLRHALKTLREQGVQGVRIERLAKDLNVTRGSFYWHFQNRQDLLQAMLDYWAEAYTGTIVDNPDFEDGDPDSILLAAMKTVREQRLDEYELAFRGWADHDPAADRVVREVYARRNEFVSGLFKRLGFRGEDSEVRTRLMLCYMSWEPNMYADESDRRRLRLLKMQHKLLTRR